MMMGYNVKMNEYLLRTLAETKIREFDREGGFSRLTGSKKMISADGFDSLPQDQRMEARALKCCGGEPLEISLAKAIHGLREEFGVCGDEDRREELRALTRKKSVELSILHERSGRGFAANEALNFVPG
jgi:hypothetical protein